MTPNKLLSQVYNELRELAAAKLALENPGHTLNATALVHEAFLKLGGERSFAPKNDYRVAAAQAMRRILVDHARARNAAKRGGGRRVELESEHLRSPRATTASKHLMRHSRTWQSISPSRPIRRGDPG